MTAASKQDQRQLADLRSTAAHARAAEEELRLVKESLAANQQELDHERAKVWSLPRSVHKAAHHVACVLLVGLIQSTEAVEPMTHIHCAGKSICQMLMHTMLKSGYDV